MSNASAPDKAAVKAYLLDLQDRICAALAAEDGGVGFVDRTAIAGHGPHEWPELATLVGQNRIRRVRGCEKVWDRAIDRRVQPARNPRSIPVRVRHFFVVVPRVQMCGQTELLLVVHALRSLRFVFGAGEDWQEHSRQDCDDGDHDQKFDQRESARHFAAHY